MIYITGDCHGSFFRLDKGRTPELADLTEQDYLIICGDFSGVIHPHEESLKEMVMLDWLNQKPFTTLFVDGNHENFDRLNEYPLAQWNGGNIHRIRPSVLHLMRGQIFHIDGYCFFTFGGAISHNVDMVFPDKDSFYKLRDQYRNPRVEHVSWWKEECPSAEEMQEGLRNLQKHNNRVDYVITHCCDSQTQRALVKNETRGDLLTDFFLNIEQKICYRKWFFGHYHDDRIIDEKHVLLYNRIYKLPDPSTKV